jgi:hypothetical protein
MYSGEQNLKKAVDAGMVEGATLIETPEKAAQKGPSIEEALNTPGFAEFIANAEGSDEIDMGDSQKIAEMYDAFTDMNVATSSIQEFLETNEAFRELGVDFGQGALPRAIAEHIQDMAYEQPEMLAQLANTFTEHKEINDAIATAEHSLLDLQGNVESSESLQATLDELRGRHGILNDAHKVSGFFARKVAGIKALYEQFAFGHSVEDDKAWLASHEGEPGGGHTRAGLEAFVEERSTARQLNDARLIVRDYYNIEIEPGAIKAEIAEVERSIQAIEGRLAVSGALEQLKEQHRDNLDILSTLINHTISTNKGLQELAWKQLEARMVGLARNPDAAFDYIEKVRSGAAALMFDPEHVEKQTAEWTNAIQTSVETAVTNAIEKAFRDASLGSNAFNNLERSLSSFIENARVGQKEGVDAQAFVMETLKSLIDKNKDNPKLRAKNILLQALVSKLSSRVEAAEIDELPEIIPLTPTPAPAEAAEAVEAPAAATGEEAVPEATEQAMSPEAETLLSEILNFSDRDKLGGLPRIMDEINKPENRTIAQEAMRSDQFIDICIKILSGKWMAGIKKSPNEDVSVRRFTQLMNEFPSETSDAVLYSTDYLMAVTKELTEKNRIGDLKRASEIFDFHGIGQFPPSVRDMLRKDERFLDIAVESLRITEYNWDCKLMKLCLDDIPEDFRDEVFNRPKFVQIFSDFLEGSYRSNKDEDMAEGLRSLAPILGEKFMKNKEIVKIMGVAQKASPKAKETPKTEEPPKIKKMPAEPAEAPRQERQSKPAPESTGAIDVEVVDAGPAASTEKKAPRNRGPIIDVVEEPTSAQPRIAIEENSARTLDAVEAATASPAPQQPESQPSPSKEAAPERAPRPRRPRRIGVTEEFNTLEEMIDAANPGASPDASSPKK